jgi:hypothetical protein
MMMRCRTTVSIRRGFALAAGYGRGGWFAGEARIQSPPRRRPRNFSRVIGSTRRMGASTTKKKKKQQHERRTSALVGRGVRTLGSRYAGNEDKRPPGGREPPLCMFSGRSSGDERTFLLGYALARCLCRAFPFRGSFGKAL